MRRGPASNALRRLVTPAAVYAVAGVAFAASPIVWDAAGRYEGRMTVPPRGQLEACAALEAASSPVDWSFKADAALDFNIHYHESERVILPILRRKQTALEGALQVARSADYCWTWNNRSDAPIGVELRLNRPR